MTTEVNLRTHHHIKSEILTAMGSVDCADS
jgi:hypothetical protein